MNIIERVENIFRRKCNVCRRSKSRAIGEQVEKLSACGVEQCPFHEDVFLAIREAQKVELLAFNLSKSEVLEGTFINISWETKNCKSVSIANYGEVELSGQKRIQVKRETHEIEIVLEDLFGETFSTKKSIQVLPKPTLEIVELTEKILKGENFSFRYSATDFSDIHLKDENRNVIADLLLNNTYLSAPISTDSKLFIHVTGKYGGEIEKEIEVKVFEPPVISFECDNYEKVDTLPIYFEFDIQNAIKTEILLNDTFISDVTETKSFTHVSENKTNQVLFPKYELAVTSLSGKILKIGLPNTVSVYPQPTIFELRVSPDSIILYPKQLTLSNRSDFCEKIIFSDGIEERIINPNDSIFVNPSESTTYSFKPIGKQNFHGEPKIIFVEVFHPIELEATTNKKITLPNLPVTIAWNAKNHTQILIEPSNVDVTNRTSYDIKLETKTVFKVIAMNKRDRKEIPLFVDVLPFQKVDTKIFGELPKLNFHVPVLQMEKPNIKKGLANTYKTTRLGFPRNLSVKILEHLKEITPKTDFTFQRMWRDKMFQELKSQKEK